jgi:hypothetical protein
MRRELLGLGAVAGILGCAAPAAAAPVPKRDCQSRGEGARPVRSLVRPGDLQLGPVAFSGLKRVAEPRGLERFGDRRDGRILLKMPLKVRAGRVVTVSVRPLGSAGLGLTFAEGAPLDTGVPTVRFFACGKDEPSFAHPGGVGPVTVFPGGFTLSEPQCALLRVRVRGHRFVYSRLVSFGMGQVSGNCDKV